MNVVILVGNYIPKCSAVGNCMKNIANCLVEEHDVTVVCFHQSKSQPVEEQIENQHIVRIDTTLMSLRNRANSAIQTAKPYAALWKGVRFYTQVARRMRLRFRKNGLDDKLVAAYVRALESLEKVPDLLVPTCMPYEAVEAATLYKNEHPKVFLVPYLFDQFADSGTLYSSSALRKSKEVANLELENKMLKASDAVLNITWEEHVQVEFPGFLYKLHHVEHPLLVKPKNRVDELPASIGTMVYADALNADAGNSSYTLDLINNVASCSTILKTVDFYVPNAPSSKHWFESLSGRSVVQLHNDISFDQLSYIYADASWLLSIGNSCADQKVNKIYEYMAFGKPIVHVACRRNDVTAGELANYPLALRLFQDDSKEENIRALAFFLKETQGKILSFDQIAKLYQEEIPWTIVETLIRSMEGCVLLFAGALTRRVNLDYMIEMLEYMPSNVQLKVHTSNAAQARLKTGLCLGVNVQMNGWVPIDKLETLYASSDCLISVGERAGKQVSSKIFGYMGAGKPIVHVYYEDNDANLPYLQKYPLALCLKADEDLLIDNTKKLKLFLLWSRHRKVPFVETMNYLSDCTPQIITQELIKTVI